MTQRKIGSDEQGLSEVSAGLPELTTVLQVSGQMEMGQMIVCGHANAMLKERGRVLPVPGL